jgi:hypothetical protein
MYQREALAKEVALELCKRNNVNPDEPEEWYAERIDLYDPSEAFEQLELMGYAIVRATKPMVSENEAVTKHFMHELDRFIQPIAKSFNHNGNANGQISSKKFVRLLAAYNSYRELLAAGALK